MEKAMSQMISNALLVVLSFIVVIVLVLLRKDIVEANERRRLGYTVGDLETGGGFGPQALEPARSTSRLEATAVSASQPDVIIGSRVLTAPSSIVPVFSMAVLGVAAGYNTPPSVAQRGQDRRRADHLTVQL